MPGNQGLKRLVNWTRHLESVRKRSPSSQFLGLVDLYRKPFMATGDKIHLYATSGRQSSEDLSVQPCKTIRCASRFKGLGHFCPLMGKIKFLVARVDMQEQSTNTWFAAGTKVSAAAQRTRGIKIKVLQFCKLTQHPSLCKQKGYGVLRPSGSFLVEYICCPVLTQRHGMVSNKGARMRFTNGY